MLQRLTLTKTYIGWNFLDLEEPICLITGNLKSAKVDNKETQKTMKEKEDIRPWE